LSQSALLKLFAALERAGVAYASLHRMLTAYFSSRECGADSEALADVTLLDRLARKIDEGVEVQNYFKYAKTIAVRVYWEYLDNQEQLRKAARELEYLKRLDVQKPEEEPDLRRRCQTLCLGGLPLAEHQLLAAYYLKAKDRDALAAELAIPIGSLRTRIHRLRHYLKECVDDCRRRA